MAAGMKKLSARPTSHAGNAARELARVVTACSITVFYARARWLLTTSASAFGAWGRKDDCARLCDHPACNAFAALRRPCRRTHQRAAGELRRRRIPGSDPECNGEPAGAAPQPTGHVGSDAAAFGGAEAERARRRRARGGRTGRCHGAEAAVRAAVGSYTGRPAEGRVRAARDASERRSAGDRQGRRGHGERRRRAWPVAADRDRRDLAGWYRGPSFPPLSDVAMARILTLAVVIA